MGATLSALEVRGLVARGPDTSDGRRVVLSLLPAGWPYNLPGTEVIMAS